MMRYLSVCSGIEAASVAWHNLGWKPAAFAEIEPFPSAVLAHRFPTVPNNGDMTKYKEWNNVGSIDLLVGGTPCQSFSVAGLRKGLEDPRGNLMLTYGAIADHYKPRWIVWENVPGVLSSNRGGDFGTFLGMLAECGYGFAYRVLDAQYHGVAQRRRRVFVVGYLGDWRPAAAVLFESEGLSWHPAPSRTPGKKAAGSTAIRTANTSANGHRISEELAHTLDQAQGQAVIMAHGQANAEIRTDGGAPALTCNHEAPIVSIPIPMINMQGSKGNSVYQEDGPSFTLNAMHGHDVHAVAVPLPVLMDQGGSVMSIENDMVGTLRRESKGHEPIIPVAFPANLSGTQCATTEDLAPSLGAKNPTAVAFDTYNQTVSDQAQTLCSRGDTPGGNAHLVPAVMQSSAVRRLTPKECERLQGFPDNWTMIPWRGKPADDCPDGPRYKACGNSMAVPVMAWIGKRIQAIEDETGEVFDFDKLSGYKKGVSCSST